MDTWGSRRGTPHLPRAPPRARVQAGQTPAAERLRGFNLCRCLYSPCATTLQSRWIDASFRRCSGLGGTSRIIGFGPRSRAGKTAGIRRRRQGWASRRFLTMAGVGGWSDPRLQNPPNAWDGSKSSAATESGVHEVILAERKLRVGRGTQTRFMKSLSGSWEMFFTSWKIGVNDVSRKMAVVSKSI